MILDILIYVLIIWYFIIIVWYLFCYSGIYSDILVFILIFLYVHLQFSAAEIAHQLESAEECNKLIVKKAVLDAGLQEYDTFVRSLFIVILIFTLFHLIIFCIIHNSTSKIIKSLNNLIDNFIV